MTAKRRSTFRRRGENIHRVNWLYHIAKENNRRKHKPRKRKVTEFDLLRMQRAERKRELRSIRGFINGRV